MNTTQYNLTSDYQHTESESCLSYPIIQCTYTYTFNHSMTALSSIEKYGQICDCMSLSQPVHVTVTHMTVFIRVVPPSSSSSSVLNSTEHLRMKLWRLSGKLYSLHVCHSMCKNSGANFWLPGVACFEFLDSCSQWVCIMAIADFVFHVYFFFLLKYLLLEICLELFLSKCKQKCYGAFLVCGVCLKLIFLYVTFR